jgi:hypothetical protein
MQVPPGRRDSAERCEQLDLIAGLAGGRRPGAHLLAIARRDLLTLDAAAATLAPDRRVV